MSRKGNRSPPSRKSLPERAKASANPAKAYQLLQSQTDSTGDEQAEHWGKADLAALTLTHSLSIRPLEARGLGPLLQEILDAAVAIGEAEGGTLQLFEGRLLHIVAHHGHQAAFLNSFAFAGNQATAWGEAVRWGQRVIVGDVENSPLFAYAASRKILREASVRAVQCTPLLTRRGKLLGILTTHWAIPHVPDERDLWRIDLLVRQAADLIEQDQGAEWLRIAGEDLQARTEQLQTTNEMLLNKQQELEAANEDLRVQEQELRSHAETLRASEERFRQVAECAGEFIWEVDAHGLYTYASPVPGRILGYQPQELVGYRGADTDITERRAQRGCCARARRGFGR